MPASLRLLGPVSAEQRGHAYKVTPDRPASLLVYLASRDAWVSRRELTFLYRPDVPEADALGYLRKLVFRARRLPWVHGLEIEDDALRWRVDSDLSRFRAAVARGQWERALAAYGGEFLAGWAVSGAPGLAEWLAVERAALAASWLRCAAGRVEQLEAAERHEEAATLLAAAVGVDPLDEENLQRYMLSLARRGKRGAALAAFDRFRRLLAYEVGGVPLETTRALADAVRRGEELGRGAPASPPVERRWNGPRLSSAISDKKKQEADVRRLAAIAVALVATAALAQSTHEVQLIIAPVEGQPIPEFYFEPAGLYVEPGDTISFVAASPHHTVTAYHPLQGKPQRVPDGVEPFSSPMIPVGTTWEYTFEIPGVYDVWCGPHESYGMVMRIVVGEASGPAVEAATDFGPEGTYGAAGTVLNDPALNPLNIVAAGSVSWAEISAEAKAGPAQPGEGAH